MTNFLLLVVFPHKLSFMRLLGWPYTHLVLKPSQAKYEASCN